MIAPGASFKDNLQHLPTIDGVERIDLIDGAGTVVASIENQPGKQGSLAVYQYLAQAFGRLDAAAAEHGLAVFAEHTADARSFPLTAEDTEDLAAQTLLEIVEKDYAVLRHFRGESSLASYLTVIARRTCVITRSPTRVAKQMALQRLEPRPAWS